MIRMRGQMIAIAVAAALVGAAAAVAGLLVLESATKSVGCNYRDSLARDRRDVFEPLVAVAAAPSSG